MVGPSKELLDKMFQNQLPPHMAQPAHPALLRHLEENAQSPTKEHFENTPHPPGGVDLTALAALAGVTSSPQVAPPPTAITLEDLEKSFQSEESSAESSSNQDNKHPASPFIKPM